MKTEKKTPKNLEELLKIIQDAKAQGSEVQIVNAETGEEGPESLMDAIREELPAGIGDMMADRIGEAFHGKQSPPTSEMVQALLDVVAVHQNPPKFKAGQFVRFRPYVTYVKSAGSLHVVTDVLAEPIRCPIDQDSSGYYSAYRNLDVIVAVFINKNTICKYYADSRELEPYPDIERLMGKHS
jgi:hypothetical protein